MGGFAGQICHRFNPAPVVTLGHGLDRVGIVQVQTGVDGGVDAALALDLASPVADHLRPRHPAAGLDLGGRRDPDGRLPPPHPPPADG